MLNPSEELGLTVATADTLLDRPRGMPSRTPLRVSFRPLRSRSRLTFIGSMILFVCSSIVMMCNFLDTRLSTTLKTVNDDSALDKLWPIGSPDRFDDWQNENSKSLRALLTCMALGTCGANQKGIVMLASDHFEKAIAGSAAGEDIWASSVLEALRRLGYTTIFTKDNNAAIAATYRTFPALVKLVILEGTHADLCFYDDHCVKSENNTLGVPAWKMLSFHFWGGARNPLGGAWTLSPEHYGRLGYFDSADNVYLGYSIESRCTSLPTRAFSDRPRQAYILGKRRDYFGKSYAWAGIDLADPPFDISFKVGISAQGDDPNVTLPAGITDLGALDRATFEGHVAESRVLLGTGFPLLSPSPYDALCLGVPFVNPIDKWDEDDPENRTKWTSQHSPLQYLDPPFVYNVKKHDKKGFWDALKSAMETPIDRYIVPEMTMDALTARVHAIVETDWKSKAQTLLETRRETGQGLLFEI